MGLYLCFCGADTTLFGLPLTDRYSEPFTFLSCKKTSWFFIVAVGRRPRQGMFAKRVPVKQEVKAASRSIA